jgi:uncharacterized protein YyaL (SSP411 family)
MWSKKELEEILERDEFNLVTTVFNVEELGNYLEEASGKKTGRNILHLKNPLEKHTQEKLKKIRLKLFDTREKRIHPHKDDKILTDWNGLMITALVKGAVAFQNEDYLNTAKKAVNFVLSKLYNQNGTLLHRYKDGISEINGFLTDYSFLIWGLIELYEATFDIFYLRTAIELHQKQIEKFWDKNIGGFFFTSMDSEELLTRQKELYDGAIPSGNSIATLNLLRLSYLTGDHELEEKADILNRVFSEKVKSNPLAYTQFLSAIDLAIGPSYSLVIGGNAQEEDTRAMIEAVNTSYIPNKVFILRKTEQENPEIDSYSNFVQFFENLDGKATAYVCINKTCKPPTHEIGKMLEYLDGKWT